MLDACPAPLFCMMMVTWEEEMKGDNNHERFSQSHMNFPMHRRMDSDCILGLRDAFYFC